MCEKRLATRRSLPLVFVFFAILCAPQAVDAQIKDRLKGTLFIDIAEAGGEAVDYGYAYDSRRREFLGGSCIQFSSMDDIVRESGDPEWEGEIKRTNSYADIAKEMNLSVAVSASYGGPGASVKVSREVDVFNQVKTHRFSQTLFARAERIQPVEYIDLESVTVGLKPETRDMLETPGRRGEFRRDCGDSFVVGIRWGHRFYGVASMTESSREFLSKVAKNFDMAGSYGNAEAATSVGNAKEFERMAGSQNLSVKVWKTGDAGFLPSDIDGLQNAFEEFGRAFDPSRNPGSLEIKGERLELMVTSYETLNDFPYRSPLAERTNEVKLGYMKDALWDLQSMIEEARFYLAPKNVGALDNPDLLPQFAFGSEPSTRRKNRARVETLRDRWKAEFEALRKLTLECMQEFTGTCEEAASLYWRERENWGQRTLEWRKELGDLPVPYASLCRDQRVTISGNDLQSFLEAKVRSAFPYATQYPKAPIVLVTDQYDPYPETAKKEGDQGWGGGRPVLARGWLNFIASPDQKELVATLGIHLSEYKKNNSGARTKDTELGGHVEAVVFPSNPVDRQNVYPRFPESCRIDRDHPVGEDNLVSLDAPTRDMASKRLHGDRPPGARGSLLRKASLGEALGISDRAYGYVRLETSNTRKWETYTIPQHGGGLLRNLQCVLRTEGRETPKTGKGRLKQPGAYCSSLTMNSGGLRFYPREDDVADRRRFESLATLEIARLAGEHTFVPIGRPVISLAEKDEGGGGDDSGRPAIGRSYKIQSAVTDKFVAVSGGKQRKGANVIQWADVGQRDLVWTVRPGPGKAIKLQNAHSRKFLAISGGKRKRGQSAIQWTDDGQRDVQWILVPAGDGTVRLKNRGTGRFLGVDGRKKKKGANILQWHKTPKRAMKWRFVPVQ